MSKRIEVLSMKVKDLKTGFGNPRKISQKKLEELEESMESLGDFGIFLVDEEDNIVAGNQRANVLMKINPDAEVCVKKLIGYSQAELRAINIKDNTHAGEWDLDLLADWTADLNLDLGIDLDNNDVNSREIPEMELIHYEKYDYVLIACRSELDYNNLVRKFGLENRKVKIASKRKINARAIWYDDLPVKILTNEEYDVLRNQGVHDEL